MTETTGYSGHQEEGINEATYGRIYTIATIKCVDDALDLAEKSMKTLQKTGKSRINIDFDVPNSIVPQLMIAIATDPTFAPYTLSGKIPHAKSSNKSGYTTIKLEYNTDIREVPDWGITKVQRSIATTLEKPSFTLDRSLGLINKLVAQGYTFDLEPSAKDIRPLREKEFDYRGGEKGVQESIDEGGYYMIVVKNKDGLPVAAAMIDKASGESSERATHHKYRGQGIMSAALLVLHAHVINNGFKKTIWGDLRYNLSFPVGHRIGFIPSMHEEEILLQTNHVCVGEKDEEDGPDPRNVDNTVIINNGPETLHMNKLRTFVVGYLSENFRDKTIIGAILRAAKV